MRARNAGGARYGTFRAARSPSMRRQEAALRWSEARSRDEETRKGRPTADRHRKRAPRPDLRSRRSSRETPPTRSVPPIPTGRRSPEDSGSRFFDWPQEEPLPRRSLAHGPRSGGRRETSPFRARSRRFPTSATDVRSRREDRASGSHPPRQPVETRHRRARSRECRTGRPGEASGPRANGTRIRSSPHPVGRPPPGSVPIARASRPRS